MDDTTLRDAWALLEQTTVQTSANSPLSHQATSKKDYGRLMKYRNVTSYSQLEVLYRCPRKFQLQKERAAFNPGHSQGQNVDFAFGHAVGAGIQHYLMTKNLPQSWLNAMLAWSADWEAEIPKKKKNLWGALIAVEKFVHVWADSLDEWELVIMPNGKPAIEVSISMHCNDGYKHYMHIDIVMRNKRTGKVAVWDAKTTGFQDAEESLYANSGQALGYAVALQNILGEEVFDYEVYYLVYSSTDREWTLLPFAKNFLESAEFVKDLVVTQDMITNYDEMQFYPKRGQSCYDYFRRCEFFGECNLTADERLPLLADDAEAEQTDYVISLQSVIDTLKARRAGKAGA